MARYEVIRPWHGVKAGSVVELTTVHPSLKSHVRLLVGDINAAAELVVATPASASEKPESSKNRKGTICKRLRELEIEFDGRKGAEELAGLLPQGEMEALFPGE